MVNANNDQIDHIVTAAGSGGFSVAAGGSSLWGSPKGDAIFVFGLPKKWEAH